MYIYIERERGMSAHPRLVGARHCYVAVYVEFTVCLIIV